MAVMTLCDHYGKLRVVCMYRGYKMSRLFVDYGWLWLCRFIELEWAKDNLCTVRPVIEPRTSCMIAGYLFHCAIRLKFASKSSLKFCKKSNDNQDLNLANWSKLKFQYKWANHIFTWEHICEAVIIIWHCCSVNVDASFDKAC